MGRGAYHLLRCPHTQQVCFKLVLPPLGCIFLHRTAYKGLYYHSQLRGRYERRLDATMGLLYKVSNLEQALIYSRIRHKKRTYAGIPTKEYKRLDKLKGARYKPAFFAYFDY